MIQKFPFQENSKIQVLVNFLGAKIWVLWNFNLPKLPKVEIWRILWGQNFTFLAIFMPPKLIKILYLPILVSWNGNLGEVLRDQNSILDKIKPSKMAKWTIFDCQSQKMEFFFKSFCFSYTSPRYKSENPKQC